MTDTAQTWTHRPRAAFRRLFLDRQAEFWMNQVDPAWSLRHLRARVLEVSAETPDTRTFVLQPNRAWRGHRSGQYAPIEVEIDGVRVTRCYSISSPPGAGPISITVKRVPGGRVSGWLHDNIAPGQVVGLGQAAGDFVLPHAMPEQLLMVSGGVGITPVMSMVRELAQSQAIDDLVFVHYARSQADVIFGEELADLAERHPGLRLIVRTDDEAGRPLGFDEGDFAALVPDFAARTTYLCGPGALMERVEKLWHCAGASTHLSRERFAPPARLVGARAPLAGVGVRLARSERRVTAAGEGALLEQLERAGERPANGCRIGICHTCTCRKHSGTVENLLTGEVSSEPDQDIQLCISVPRSDLDLDL